MKMEIYQIIGFTNNMLKTLIVFERMETCTRGSRERITDTLVDCEVMEKYLLVGWPEIQMFMDHPR